MSASPRPTSAGKRLINIVIYGLMGIALLAAVASVPQLLRRLNSEEATRWIEVGELAPRLDGAEALAVIDVRSPDEFVGPLGHIPKARNVPLAELRDRIEELRALVEMPVVVVCRTDNRSASAAALLKEAGFRNVVALRGGMVRWNEAGLPVEDRLSPTGAAASRSGEVGC